MNIDPDLLEKVKGKNVEFCKLYEERAMLKSKVDKFNQMKIITPKEETENKKYQKQKLNLKDKMEKILGDYNS